MKFKRPTRGLIALVLVLAGSSLPESGQSTNHDDFAGMDMEELMQVQVFVNPPDALTRHIHAKGDWMVGFQDLHLRMEGNRDGSSDRSSSEILRTYPVVPTSMTIESHRFNLMYAPSDNLTLMVFARYFNKEMHHLDRQGRRFYTSSSGWGDMSFMMNYVVLRSTADRHLVILNGGLGVPTGSIDRTDETPNGKERLAYTMQPGSGTFDYRLGVTYQHLRAPWRVGLGLLATIRQGKNDHNYALGNELQYDVRFTRKLANYVTATLKFNGHEWQDVKGAAADLDPVLSSIANPALGSGTRLDMGLSLEFHGLGGSFDGHLWSIEYSSPIYEHVDGPWPSVDERVVFGWQWVF